MSRRAPSAEDAAGLVAAYKTLLRDALILRPSGTRQRLATMLGKDRSFISQIANPTYPVPIPAQHLTAIFDVCHLSPLERTAFLEAYRAAHPRRLLKLAEAPQLRLLMLSVPDLGKAANQTFDEALSAFAERQSKLLRKGAPEKS